MTAKNTRSNSFFGNDYTNVYVIRRVIAVFVFSFRFGIFRTEVTYSRSENRITLRRRCAISFPKISAPLPVRKRVAITSKTKIIIIITTRKRGRTRHRVEFESVRVSAAPVKNSKKNCQRSRQNRMFVSNGRGVFHGIVSRFPSKIIMHVRKSFFVPPPFLFPRFLVNVFRSDVARKTGKRLFRSCVYCTKRVTRTFIFPNSVAI